MKSSSKVTHILKLAVAVAWGVAITPTVASAHDRDGIEGVWQVTRHGVNCQTGLPVNSFQAIMAFNKDGIVTGYAVPPGSTPANGSPEYGTWQREKGPQSYSFKILSYGYDDNGAFDGSVRVSGNTELARGGDTFSYVATIQFLAADGTPLFSVCGAATGTRFD